MGNKRKKPLGGNLYKRKFPKKEGVKNILRGYKPSLEPLGHPKCSNLPGLMQLKDELML